MIGFSGFIEWIGAWWNSRRWIPLAISAVVVGLMLLPTLLSVLIRAQPNESLGRSMAEAAEFRVSGQAIVDEAFEKLYLEATLKHVDESQVFDEVELRNKKHAYRSDAAWMRKVKSAEITYLHLARLLPSDSTTRFRLAMIYELLDRRPEAVDLVQSLAPENHVRYLPAHACLSLYLMIDDEQAAGELLRFQHHARAAMEWIDMDPRFLSTGSYFSLARQQNSIAIDLARAAAIRSHQFSFRLASLLYQLDRQADAKLVLEDAVIWIDSNFDPEDRGVVQAKILAWCLERLDAADKAKEVLLKAYEHSKGQDVQLNQILVDRLVHEFRRPWEQLERNWRTVSDTLDLVVQLDSARPEVGELASLCLLHGIKTSSEVQSALKHQVQENLLSTQARWNLALVWQKKGKVLEAKKQLERLLQDDRNHVEALTMLASIGFKLPEVNLAEIENWVSRALQAGGQSAELFQLAGEVAVRDGQWQAAIDHWEKSLQLDPKNTELRRRIVHAYATIGNYDAVERHRQALIRTMPQDSLEGPMAVREGGSRTTPSPSKSIPDRP